MTIGFLCLGWALACWFFACWREAVAGFDLASAQRDEYRAKWSREVEEHHDFLMAMKLIGAPASGREEK